MNQNSSDDQNLKSHPSNIVSASLIDAAVYSQDMERFPLTNIRSILTPGNQPGTEGTRLKVLVRNGVDQGLLKLAGAHYEVKGHAAKKSKSKGRKKSAGGGKKKGGKKSSKGRKKSAGKKRKASKKSKAPEEPPKQ